MALVGNLRDFGLSEFLYLVDRGYKTGRLTLQKPGDRAELYFQNGKLVYATHFNQDERLGDMLVRLGRITQEQLTLALRIQQAQAPDTPIGVILVGRNVITQEEINRAVRSQIEEITYSLFAWTEGDFRFEPDVNVPKESITIPLSIENIIMEGTRRIDEWERIRERIPNLDVVVRFSDQPQEKAKGVNLTPDEWRVFARINGAHSIRQIAQSTGLGEFDVARIIYGFLSAGLVVLTKQAPRPNLGSPARAGQVATPPPPSNNGFRPAAPPPANIAVNGNGNGQYDGRYGNEPEVRQGRYSQPPAPQQKYKRNFIQRIIDAVARR